MPIDSPYHSVQVISNELVANSLRFLKLDTGQNISYEAGQFFILRLRDPQGNYTERSYSVANYSNDNILEFAIRIEEHGKMTSLIDMLNAEDKIDLKGPFGNFGYPFLKDELKKLVLIAGGVGIAPIRSMLEKTFSGGDTFPIQLFYGFRNQNEFLFTEELNNYEKSERLELITSASNDESQSDLTNHGYITEYFSEKLYPAETGNHCYICGPPPMVKDSREKLFTLGFSRDQVHIEAW